jgi:hypothetical protein
MAMPDVYVRGTEAEGERWIERDRETRQFFVSVISGEQQSRAPPTKLGLCSIRACKRPVFTDSRICSASPLASHLINSEMVDPHFVLRIGNQRITAMPNFRAYTTAIRAGGHSRGSWSYRQH